MDIDRAGFVPRETCYCNCEFREWRSEEDSYWYWDGKYAEKTGEPGGGKWFEVAWGYTDEMATGYVDTCRRCRAELAVFIDPDGTRRPMVRRAGFWRDVALDLSRILPRGKAELQWAVRRAMAADGLNAPPAGETMGAAERTEIQWSGKPGICYLCGNMGVVTKERLLRIDAFRQCEAANKRLRQVRRWAAAWKRAAKRLAVGFLNERRAVEALAEQCASQKPQRMPWMGCPVPVPAPDGYPGCLLGGRRPDCVRCWSEWAREQAHALRSVARPLATRMEEANSDAAEAE